MGLLDYDPDSTLQDVLGQQADTLSMGVGNASSRKRRKAASLGAATGRLGSGVQNYTLGDINAGELEELGSIQSGLAGALGEIPTNDYLSSQEFDRKRNLARLIGELSQGDDGGLGALFGGLQGAASGATSGFSVGGPWGAVIGGAAGAGLGAYGGANRRRTA